MLRVLKKDGIVGFSYEIDASFDPYSLYFLAQRGEDMVAFLRMVFKSPKNKLPMETALINSNTRVSNVDEVESVELTTFWCKDFLSLEPLARTSFKCLYDKQIKKVYSTKEFGENRIGSIYKKLGLERSKVTEKFYYPTYGRLDDAGHFKPIVWEPYEGDKSRIDFVVNRLK